MADKTNILIIGGGWSGLSAAITLTQQGHAIHLIESAKQLGGRARNVQWHNQTVDNGQHLMIGAYVQMLAIMNTIGIDTNKVFNRLPMDISIYDSHYSISQLGGGTACSGIIFTQSVLLSSWSCWLCVVDG